MGENGAEPYRIGGLSSSVAACFLWRFVVAGYVPDFRRIVLDVPGLDPYYAPHVDAGWSSLVARRAHNPKVVSSNLAPATTKFIIPSLV